MFLLGAVGDVSSPPPPAPHLGLDVEGVLQWLKWQLELLIEGVLMKFPVVPELIRAAMEQIHPNVFPDDIL